MNTQQIEPASMDNLLIVPLLQAEPSKRFTATVKPTRKPDPYRVTNVSINGTVCLRGDRCLLHFNIFTKKFRFLKEINESVMNSQPFSELSPTKPELSEDFIQWITDEAIATGTFDMTKQTFSFYSDASHGWLCVHLYFIELLGLKEKISSCSYISVFDQRDPSNANVFLEEDQDALLFTTAYFDKYGSKPKIKDCDDGDRSRIRTYRQYPYFRSTETEDLWYNIEYYEPDGDDWKETDQRPSDSDKKALAYRLTSIQSGQKKHSPGDGYHYIPVPVKAFFSPANVSFSRVGWTLSCEDSTAAIFAHAEDICNEFGLDFTTLHGKACPYVFQPYDNVDPDFVPSKDILATPEERAICTRPATKDDVQAVLADLRDINFKDLANVLEAAIAEVQNPTVQAIAEPVEETEEYDDPFEGFDMPDLD